MGAKIGADLARPDTGLPNWRQRPAHDSVSQTPRRERLAAHAEKKPPDFLQIPPSACAPAGIVSAAKPGPETNVGIGNLAPGQTNRMHGHSIIPSRPTNPRRQE